MPARAASMVFQALSLAPDLVSVLDPVADGETDAALAVSPDDLLPGSDAGATLVDAVPPETSPVCALVLELLEMVALFPFESFT